MQDDIPPGRSEFESTLASGDRLIMRTHNNEMDYQRERDLSQPMVVVESHREGFSLAQSHQDTPRIAEWAECRAQGEPEIDGLLACVTSVGEMLEGAERLLEVSCGLAVGRLCQGLLPRLPAVRQGLVPYFPPQGMVRQAFDLLGHPLSGERIEGLDDAGMQSAPPLLQETTVGDLMGQGVLEGEVALGEQLGLVEELSGLQVR